MPNRVLPTVKTFRYHKMPAHVNPAMECLCDIAYRELELGKINAAVCTLENVHSIIASWNGKLLNQEEKFINRMNAKIVRLELIEMRKLLEVPKKDQTTPLDSDPALA